MNLKKQIYEVLFQYGITRAYKGFFPLANLIELFINQSFFGPQLIEVVAARHHISVSTLRRQIKVIANDLDCRDHTSFRQLNGSEQYQLSRFVTNLARIILEKTE